MTFVSVPIAKTESHTSIIHEFIPSSILSVRMSEKELHDAGNTADKTHATHRIIVPFGS